MVRHDHERMKLIMSQHVRVVVDGFYDHVGDGWLAKIDLATASFVK
jgi:hypothetical protein